MEQLGIEPKLLLAQIVNFLIIVFVLSKVLYKPVLSMLEKRRKEIAEGLAISDRMRLEEEKFQEKKAARLEVARKEAKTIIEEAKKRGCHYARLATGDYQAPDFYRKVGYRLYGELENCPRGETVYYFCKELA